MPKVTGKYETIFIVDVTKGEEFQNSVLERFKTLIEENAEPETFKVDDWGKRRLAYPIDDMPEGYYTLVEFECKPDFPAELDRVYKITDGLMRSLIIAK